MPPTHKAKIQKGMKGITEYIVKFDTTHQTTVKVGGHSLKVNPNFEQPKWINRIGVVENVPFHLEKESPIKKGYEVLVIHTVLLNEVYNKTGLVKSHFIVDEEKGLFRFEPNLIVMWRENKDREWKAHLENIMVEPISIKDEEREVNGLILPDNIFENEKGYKGNQTQHGIIAYDNPELNKKGVFKNDEVIIKKDREYEFEIDGKTYWHMENVDIVMVEKAR